MIRKEQRITIFHCKSCGLFDFLYYVQVLLLLLKFIPQGKFSKAKLNVTRLPIFKKVTNSQVENRLKGNTGRERRVWPKPKGDKGTTQCKSNTQIQGMQGKNKRTWM